MKANKFYHKPIIVNRDNQFCTANNSMSSWRPRILFIVMLLSFSTLNNLAVSNNQTNHFKVWLHNSDKIELQDAQNIYSVNVKGRCVIDKSNPNSLIRIILVTSDSDEKLIAEYNWFNCNGDTLNIENENIEAYFDKPVNEAKIKIVIVDASLFIESIDYDNQHRYGKNDINNIRKQKETEKIRDINDYLERNGMLWRAGETYFSGLSYSQLKAQLYGESDSVFLHGYEYYSKGIFSFLNPSMSSVSENTNRISSFPETFSWTRRHGVNWNTPVKDQTYPTQPDSVGNGGCWAFAPIALSECYANIYYNRRINLDLSEQDVISCSGEGSCVLKRSRGGSPVFAMYYIINDGVVSENCFPFTNSDAPCSDKCGENPVFSGSNIGRITRLVEDSIKSLLINKGPVLMRIDNEINTVSNHGTHHAILLVGYGTVKAGENYSLITENQNSTLVTVPVGSPFIGQTYWICKNSYGIDHVESGYDYFIFDSIDRMSEHLYLYGAPTVSGYYTNDILCEDLDGDGYYNWGIGPKPTHCPSCPDLPDGNDYNPNIGGMDATGNSLYLGDLSQAPYIEGADAIGCSGDFYIANLPENVNVTWSIAPSLLNTTRIVDIIGPTTEAMVRVRQLFLPSAGLPPLSGYVTLKADFVDNGTPLQLTKRVFVSGNRNPYFNTEYLNFLNVGTSKTITELNCTNIPSQYLRWDLNVPGVGRYSQFGHSVTICPTAPGFISITVTNLLACETSESSFSHSIRVISPHFAIVNNPVNEALSVELFECNERGSRCSLEITDAMGNVMYNGTVRGDFMSIDTSMFIDGVYTIRLLLDGQCVQVEKFIKQ